MLLFRFHAALELLCRPSGLPISHIRMLQLWGVLLPVQSSLADTHEGNVYRSQPVLFSSFRVGGLVLGLREGRSAVARDLLRDQLLP